MTPEGKVKGKIKAHLSARGIPFFMPQGTITGTNGVPDIICTLPPWGQALYIEVKATAKDAPTVLQAKFLRERDAVGAIAFVVDADNLAGFVWWLDNRNLPPPDETFFRWRDVRATRITTKTDAGT